MVAVFGDCTTDGLNPVCYLDEKLSKRGEKYGNLITKPYVHTTKSAFSFVGYIVGECPKQLLTSKVNLLKFVEDKLLIWKRQA